jgi:hypothetical protein
METGASEESIFLFQPLHFGRSVVALEQDKQALGGSDALLADERLAPQNIVVIPN